MQILLTIILVTTIVIILTSAVLVARRLLVSSGDVSILINDSRSMIVSAGDKLLWTLAEKGVYLPAACGGRGSCGQCRTLVNHGGGQAQLTEMTHLSKRELRDHWRLACMVTVRDGLSITLPDTVFDAREWSCKVQSNQSISTYQAEIILQLEDAEAFDFEAGSYVLLHAPAGKSRFSEFDIDDEFREEWQNHNLFDLVVERDETTVRAYSIANYPLERGIVMFVIRIALPPPNTPAGTPPGRVSSFAFGLKPGDPVTVSGPFGTFRASGSQREMVFIGGGAGIAPLRSIICDQLLHKKSGRKMTFFYGARSLRDLCYRIEFDELTSQHDNFMWHVALSEPRTEDHWSGSTGFIHTVFYERLLENHPCPEEAEYYICGPPVMSNAVLGMLEDVGVGRENVYFDDFGS